MNRKKGTIIGVILGIPLLIGLGAGVAIVVVNQLGYVKSSNTAESDKSSNTAESGNRSISSDPEEFYIGKDTKGSKVYIKPEDVKCNVEKVGDSELWTSYSMVNCTANGYKLTLSDEKILYSDDRDAVCASTAHQRKYNGEWVETPGSNNNPLSFTCIAAEKYGKYQPF